MATRERNALASMEPALSDDYARQFQAELMEWGPEEPTDVSNFSLDRVLQSATLSFHDVPLTIWVPQQIAVQIPVEVE